MKIAIYSLFVVSCLTLTASATELVLAARGKVPAYTIVIPAKASPTQRYAAEELRDFTARMTGVKLPIATDDKPLPTRHVRIASSTDAKLGEDGFRLQARDGNLLISASPVRGALYGVYELLERFGGCRWYSSWCDRVPSRETFAVPDTLDEAQTPAFLMREPFWFDVLAHGDFAARVRCNCRSWRSVDAKYGGNSFRFGGGLGSCHTFETLVPLAKYGKDHPEYFALRDGKRRAETKGEVQWYVQLCLTNPDVLKLVVEGVKARIRQDPGAKFYGVSQNDNPYYCQCEKCAAIDAEEDSHAGTVVRFVNAVAEEVEKEFPNVVIETLAYQFSRKPPKKTRLRHNVIPCLCSIECDFARPIPTSPYKDNIAFRDDIRGWSKQTDMLYVWDYTTNFRHYPHAFPNVYALQDNIRFFRDNGVKCLFEQGAYQGRHADFAELKAWLMAKWMWNPELPMKELLDDFFNGYYGKGAPFVRAYFEELHQLQRDYSSDPKKPLCIFEDVTSPALSDEFFEKAADLWAKAAAAVKDDPVRAYNVRMGSFSVDYTRLERLRRKTNPILVFDPAWAGEALLARRDALAKSLLARMDEAKDIRICEGADRHASVPKEWREIVASKPRRAEGDRAELEESFLTIVRRGDWGDFVDDPQATDGKALKLFNTHFEWCTSLQMSKIAFEPGAKYTIRVRARVEPKAGAKGQAFWSGVYDPVGKKGCGAGCCPSVTDVKPGYQWYDVATWVPKSTDYFWIGPGFYQKNKGETTSIEGVWIDKVELIRVAQRSEKWLDEFDLATMSCGVGKRPQINKSCLGNPLRMGAGVYKRGVGTHGESVFVLKANGKVKAFDAIVGLDKDALEMKFWAARKGWAQVQFRVYADGRKVAESPLVQEGKDPVPFHVDLTGAQTIVLEASHGGHWASAPLAFADWAEAKFTLDEGGEIAPHPDANLTRQLGILTPPIPAAPRINGAGVWGVRPWHPILWRVPVSGERPIKLTAVNLPAGATFDAEKGFLGGAVAKPGDYVITFTAENAKGKTSRDLVLKVGEKICLTPPLGWNSWNIYGGGVTDAKVRAIARGMHESGLADHGWSYVNIDDWWMKNKEAGKTRKEHAGPTRDAQGRFIPQSDFPDMKALADYVHSLGLKIGIYSSPGETTCGGCEGSLGHEMIDAQTWADWGIDYLKHDWCSYGKVFGAETKGRQPTTDDYAKPYRLMTKCLRAQNRDIVHAFCQYGMGNVQAWGEAAGAQVWRSWGDLKDAWSCINNAIEAYAEAYKYTRPGFWCDPDMMVLGYLNTDQGMHDTYLTPNEQYTHVSMWVLLNSPMLLGCDLNHLNDFTRNLLMNDEILAISQDTLGRQAGRIYKDEGASIWWRPLANGDSAAGLVNQYPFTRKISFNFKDAGLEGAYVLRDCWRQEDIGTFSDSFTCEVPPHATMMLRLRKVRRLVWADEFNGTKLDTTRWDRCQKGGSDWCRHMSTRPDLVEVKDGALVLWGVANTDTNADPRPFLTGGVQSPHKGLMGIGKVEMRVKIEDQKGAWPALWMLGDKPDAQGRNWPWAGEIDIVERLNGDPFVYQTVHSGWTYVKKHGDKPQHGSRAGIRPGDWNVYGLEVTKDALIWSVNGEETFRYPKTDCGDPDQWPFGKPFYFLLDMQLSGRWVGNVDMSTLPVRMFVDWIRVYE